MLGLPSSTFQGPPKEAGIYWRGIDKGAHLQFPALLRPVVQVVWPLPPPKPQAHLEDNLRLQPQSPLCLKSLSPPILSSHPQSGPITSSITVHT